MPCRAAAAKKPVWRIAPPSMRRCRVAAAISSREPASSEPPGAPSPFENDDRDEVERRRQLGLGEAARDARVPQARAVEEGRDAARARQRADAHDLVLREDDAAAAVVRVLDLDQRRRRIDRQAARLDRGLELGDVEHAARADLDQLHAGVGRRAAGLVPAGVRLAADDRPRRPAASARAARPGWPSCPTAARAPLPCRAARRRAPAARWCVGSSPYWSSPTGAAAIAARIAGVGRVTVSERRSIGHAAISASRRHVVATTGRRMRESARPHCGGAMSDPSSPDPRSPRGSAARRALRGRVMDAWRTNAPATSSSATRRSAAAVVGPRRRVARRPSRLCGATRRLRDRRTQRREGSALRRAARSRHDAEAGQHERVGFRFRHRSHRARRAEEDVVDREVVAGSGGVAVDQAQRDRRVEARVPALAQAFPGAGQGEVRRRGAEGFGASARPPRTPGSMANCRGTGERSRRS